MTRNLIQKNWSIDTATCCINSTGTGESNTEELKFNYYFLSVLQRLIYLLESNTEELKYATSVLSNTIFNHLTHRNLIQKNWSRRGTPVFLGRGVTHRFYESNTEELKLNKSLWNPHGTVGRLLKNLEQKNWSMVNDALTALAMKSGCRGNLEQKNWIGCI